MAIADIADISIDRAEPKRLRIERRFTREGVHPYDTIEWELRDSVIPGENGNVFEQKGVEVPRFWSQTATKDRKSTRLNSSHCALSRMPSSA